MSDKAHILEALRDCDSTGFSLPEIPPNSELFSVPHEPLASLFQRQLERLSGEVIRVKDAGGARNVLTHLVGDQSAATDGSDALSEVVKGIPVIAATDHQAAAAIDIGITGADALVARTGSVILSSSHGGRRLSALPPTHVVIAGTSQIVPTLSDVSVLPKEASTLTIISGPSRTADIEKILVLGAHGPKRLVVILIDEN